MGVDPARDLRPHVAAAAANGAARDVWMGDDAPAERVSDLMDQVLAILEDGVNYPSKPAGA